jgi:HSP20 family protein
MLATNRLQYPGNAWNLFNQMQEDFSRELSGWFAAASTTSKLPLGVWTKDNEALIAVELPGRESSDIDVSVHRDVVTIETKPAAEELPEVATILRRERSLDGMRRQFQLPFEPDPDRIDATYERGMLVLRLTAHESMQPAKIEVKAG